MVVKAKVNFEFDGTEQCCETGGFEQISANSYNFFSICEFYHVADRN